MEATDRKNTTTNKQIADNPTYSKHQNHIGLVREIAESEYNTASPLLSNLLFDVSALYEGLWPTHEACQVEYHTFGHAIDVALSTARMIAGWNKTHNDFSITEDVFLCAMAAAVFHDAGYIKDKGDQDGHGGKFTFNHVERSMNLAREYLKENNWPSQAVDVVPRIISITEYQKNLDPVKLFNDKRKLAVARMVATSDLIAQMADVNYLQRLKYLFAEFKEGYEFESAETLAELGLHVFKSVKEIMDGTTDFYENFVVPRLKAFGHMDQYLNAFFGGGRNPYQENIAANLSAHLMDKRGRWKKLGVILEELGLISCDQVQKALKFQKQKGPASNKSPGPIKKQIIPWFENHYKGNCLGDILMDMGAISSASLCKGLLSQMLPQGLIEELSIRELRSLIQISILLQNIGKGPWILQEVMEMTKKTLACEASSVLLINPDTEDMLVSLPTGPKSDFLKGKSVPTDKGLGGWVYRNERSVIVSDVLVDERFDREVDLHIGFETRSVMAVPLHANGECIGVLEFINKENGKFSQHDMHLLIVLANMIATSLAGLICQQ